MQEGYKSEKHNYTLDVWKFTLCVGVICLHMNSYWGLFRTGYLGVDFLLIISGYFLGFSARKLGSSLSIIDYIRELFKWIIKRFIRLYPLYLIAIMMTWGIDNYTTKRTLSDGCYALWQSNTELIMMQSIKWPVWGLINFPDWYVSAIFISGIIVLIVASLLFKAKSKILGFLFGMLCYFLIIYKFSTVDVVTEKWGGVKSDWRIAFRYRNKHMLFRYKYSSSLEKVLYDCFMDVIFFSSVIYEFFCKECK